MADELTLNIGFDYSKSGTSISERVTNLAVDVSGTKITHTRQAITTSEVALDLGGLSTGGYLLAINRDATNYVSIRPGTGATNVVRILPGEVALFRIDSAASAPYAIANTATVELEFWLLSA